MVKNREKTKNFQESLEECVTTAFLSAPCLTDTHHHNHKRERQLLCLWTDSSTGCDTEGQPVGKSTDLLLCLAHCFFFISLIFFFSFVCIRTDS